MAKKIIILILIFYFFIIFQTSFLSHFKLPGALFNLILIAVIIINFLKIPDQQKTAASLVGGLFLDIFSLNNFFGFFGFFTLILLLFSYVLRIILKRYVRISFT